MRQAVGGGCRSGWGGHCRLQMPLKLALAIRGTVAGHRLGALEDSIPRPPGLPPCAMPAEPRDEGGGAWRCPPPWTACGLVVCGGGDGTLECLSRSPRPTEALGREGAPSAGPASRLSPGFWASSAPKATASSSARVHSARGGARSALGLCPPPPPSPGGAVAEILAGVGG